MSTDGNSEAMFRASSGTASAASATAKPTTAHPTSGGLRVRWDRLGIAVAGCLGLVAALVTSVLAVGGLVSPMVPVIALLIAIAGVVVLRTLAVRDRRRRAASRPLAQEQPAAPAEDEAPSAQRPTQLFDAEDGPAAGRTDDDAAASESAPSKFTAAELRAAALAVAVEAGDQTIGTGAPWQPVDVPKPTYVEAPKAERQDPAPLDLPETPKAQTKTPIKNGAVAPKVETPSAPRMNLDDILQRRRA